MQSYYVTPPLRQERVGANKREFERSDPLAETIFAQCPRCCCWVLLGTPLGLVEVDYEAIECDMGWYVNSSKDNIITSLSQSGGTLMHATEDFEKGNCCKTKAAKPKVRNSSAAKSIFGNIATNMKTTMLVVALLSSPLGETVTAARRAVRREHVPSMATDVECDVVVVGGSVAGLSAAVTSAKEVMHHVCFL